MAAVLSGFSLANVACRGYAQDSTVYTVSGYILDANGNGIKGAQIIFNVPDVVKSVYSDSTGHYAIYAPVGTYHLNVWPPWDSSYIDYDQSGLVVSSDMTKNITLNQGCKLSGYITDMSGNPVQGAVVSLNGYLAGWFSNYQGYYFVCAPAGTYKLTVNPRSGYHHFVNYYESNLSLKQNVTKNITVVLTNNSNPSPSPGHGPFKISGYILDANGKGIKGAMVIFGVPDIVPSVYSDSAGYYAIYAPSGSYYLNVWPPFDSNFIYYDQPILTVSADMTKNITLSSGYKVSGYITSTTGQPVKDGLVLLDNYLSGWFSKDTGYYFVCAPAGTYKLWASPRNGYNHFAIYSESNFVLDRNIVKNIIVVLTGTPTPSPTPEPTPSPTPDQGWISISVDAQSPVVGSMVSVMGRLTDYDEHPIPNKPITLSYADTTNAELSWTNIGSATTTATGEYSIQWRIAAAGNFLFKVEWIISGNFAAAINTTSVGFLPADSKLTMPAEPGNTIVSQQAYTVETEQEVNTDVSCWLWVGVVTLAIAVVIVTALAVRTVKNKTTSRTVQKQALK
jgi:protocatechuate 3,4-dioxygenase beta subunit